uniref:Mitochondrial fission 1 protein n=1 Tax=Rhabditophanes sp. KR3021 TaxID=114890 RepID=A0AC35TWV1_9BILA
MDIAQIVDENISHADLARFRQVYMDQVGRGQVSGNDQFSYAHALIKSDKNNIKEGVKLLETLLAKNNDGIPKRDTVYYLALAHTRLKDYDRALAYLDALLSAEEHNRQAIELKELVSKRMKIDGLWGLALVSGSLVAFGALAIGAILSGKK